jgi:FtsH-binding integral membrane protein
MNYDARYDTADMDLFVADASQDARVAFIRRVYAHVAGATLLFVGLTAALINIPAISQPLAEFAFGHWWAVLLSYMIAGWVAHRMAASQASVGVQYMGLGLFALAEAFIFTPLLYILHQVGGGDDIILQAGILTLVIFGGLTAVVMITKTDFSFLRGILTLLMFVAIGLALVAAFTTFSLGTWFLVAMIALMSGFILYETSNVLHHYHTSQHVAASLAIFSSLTTLFWYVLQLVSYLGIGDD